MKPRNPKDLEPPEEELIEKAKTTIEFTDSELNREKTKQMQKLADDIKKVRKEQEKIYHEKKLRKKRGLKW